MKAVGWTLAALLVVASCTGDDEADPVDLEDFDEFDDDEFDDEFDDEGFEDEFDEFDDDGFDDDEGTDDEPVEVGATGRIDLDDDLYLVEHGASRSGEEITIDVADGDASVLITFVGADPDAGMFVVEGTGPDGENVLIDGAEPFNNGEVTLSLPALPGDRLTAGEHAFVVESAGEIPRILSVHKTAVDPEQVLDVRFWVASTSPDVAEPERPELGEIFRDVGEQIFSPFGLGIGELEFIDAPPEIVDEFAVIDLPTSGNDADHRRLCREMSSALEPARALNFVIVDRADDPEDQDAETEGNAAGLPGAPPLEGSLTSCVFMIADGSRPISEIGNVVWHEAAHLLGLFHTTEEAGDSFDVLDDTPECDAGEFDTDGDGIVVFEECPDGDNVMFYDGDGLVLTEQQAAVLALHPLFRPA